MISQDPGGGDIAQEPGTAERQPRRVHPSSRAPVAESTTGKAVNPGVSIDGSHILMSTRADRTAFGIRCRRSTSTCASTTRSPTTSPRVTDVDYVGMTTDGSKVFFTTRTAELRTDRTPTTSVDLYMWSESTDSLTA